MQSVDAAGVWIGDAYPPRIMGVVNLSLESPYTPSVFAHPGEAAEFIDDHLIDQGADIVDIGLTSANKRVEPLTVEEERARLDTAIDTLASVSGDAVFSIETRYAAIAEAALDGGFDMVNDICGFADPELPTVCVDYDVAVIKMAGPGDLARPGALSSVDAIYDALAAEPLPPKTIIDPAFGGWCEEHSVELDRETFRRLAEFRAIDRPMLVSINRKNFLRHLADRTTEDALPVSLAATALAVERGANVIRTHDVAETRDAAIVGDAFSNSPRAENEYGVRELDISSPGAIVRHLERIGAGSAAAFDGYVRAFELRDLNAVDQALLANLVSGIGGTLATGEDNVAVLFATPRTLRRLQSAVGGESRRLSGAFEFMLANEP